MKDKGYIIQTQDFSVNDGEGIRSTIFLAGCPLRCRWCSNPEGFTTEEKIGYFEELCINCGLCEEVCKNEVSININDEREKCKLDGNCINICPTNARRYMVNKINVEEIIEHILEYDCFFKSSEGGVTFSGGEPTYQLEFLERLVDRLYDEGISLAIETSGYFEYDKLKNIFKKMDLVFMDIKHMDEDKHKEFTGVSNKRILENIKNIDRLNLDLVIRIPLIIGVNSDMENIKKLVEFILSNQLDVEIELLPYHELAIDKYESLGYKYDFTEFNTPKDSHMEKIYDYIEKKGIRRISYT